MFTPKIAIIILDWNRLQDTRECLDSLRQADYPNFKTIVVDNGSPGPDAETLAKEYGGFIQVIKNETNLGFAEGNNVAIRAALKDAEVKYVFLLNNDTTVDQNFLTEAVSIIHNSKFKIQNYNIGMVAIRMMDYYKPDEIDSLGVRLTRGGLAFNIKQTSDQLIKRSEPMPIAQYPILFCPCGGAALYSQEMLEAVALRSDEHSGDIRGHLSEISVPHYFDPSYFCYAEDLDLGFRGRLAGFDCVLADKSIVYHKGSASTSKMSDFSVYHTYRNVVWTLIKDLPCPLLLKYLPKIIIGQAAIILLYFFRRKPGLILKAYFDAFKKLPGALRKRRQIKKTKKISNKELSNYIEKKIF